MTFRHERPLTFSPVRLQELHGKFPPADQEPLTASTRRTSEQQSVMRAAIDYDVERAIRERARAYGEETPRDRLFRWGQCVALVLAIAFVATVVVLMSILAIRVSDAVDGLGGEETSDKVSAMMDLALEGAQNARAATRNVLHVTEYARGAASVATPRLVHAVNETSDLVEDLRSWSFHPSLQIAPGGIATSASG